MATIGEPTEIAQYVNLQLLEYVYMCPVVVNVSLCLTLSSVLMVCHQFSLSQGLVRHTLPFCNAHIITVLRDHFFSGGSRSFVNQFSGIFTIEDGISLACCEVPLAMVCLVATAVSCKSNVFLNSALIFFLKSYMPLFTSGRQARNNMSNSPQVRFWIYIQEM